MGASLRKGIYWETESPAYPTALLVGTEVPWGPEASAHAVQSGQEWIVIAFLPSVMLWHVALSGAVCGIWIQTPRSLLRFDSVHVLLSISSLQSGWGHVPRRLYPPPIAAWEDRIRAFLSSSENKGLEFSSYLGLARTACRAFYTSCRTPGVPGRRGDFSARRARPTLAPFVQLQFLAMCVIHDCKSRFNQVEPLRWRIGKSPAKQPEIQGSEYKDMWPKGNGRAGVPLVLEQMPHDRVKTLMSPPRLTGDGGRLLSRAFASRASIYCDGRCFDSDQYCVCCWYVKPLWWVRPRIVSHPDSF